MMHLSFIWKLLYQLTIPYFRDPPERKLTVEINHSAQNEFKWQSNAGEADREHFTLTLFHNLLQGCLPPQAPPTSPQVN